MTTKSQEKVDEIGKFATLVFFRLNRLLYKADLTAEQMVKLNEYTEIFSRYVHLMIDLARGEIQQSNKETALELHQLYIKLTDSVSITNFADRYTNTLIRSIDRIKKVAGYVEIVIETKTKVGNIFTQLINKFKTFRTGQGN